MVVDKRALQGKNTIAELKAMLKPGGKGSIVISVALEEKGREVELALPGRFDISPAQQGEISTVPGVLEVVEV